MFNRLSGIQSNCPVWWPKIRIHWTGVNNVQNQIQQPHLIIQEQLNRKAAQDSLNLPGICREKKKTFEIKWSIASLATSYQKAPQQVSALLNRGKKTFVILAETNSTLNRRHEIMSKCRLKKSASGNCRVMQSILYKTYFFQN